MTDSLPVAVTLIAVLGGLSQWVAWRLHLPAIVVLSAAGLLAGPVLGWLHPTAAFGELLQPMVGLAVAVILFEGGLRLKLHDLKEAARGVRRLCTLGLALAFVLGTLAARFIAGLSLPVSEVLGAILVVTGPTVIVPLLRTARLQRKVASLLKWEGIVNDPLGALLAVLVFEFHLHAGEAATLGAAAGGLGLALLAGLGLGGLGGLLLGQAFRHGKVPEYQKAPLLLAAVFAVSTLANLAQHEAGLLASTVMGVVIGNMGLASLADLTRFKDSLVVLLVSAVFIVLTAELDASLLASFDPRALLFITAMLLVVRPASILLATIGAGLSGKERLLLAWIAPRGVVAAAVAGVFGPELVTSGHPDGALLLPIVFGMVLATVTLHGLSLRFVAGRLGLSSTGRRGLLIVGASRWSTELASSLLDLDVPVILADTSWTALKRARLAGVRVHYGEVLSEGGEQSLPLEQVGAVLAATGNDAYNALVCVHFGPELGRDRVYQLAGQQVDGDDPRSVLVTLRGRLALSEDATFDRLIALHWQGWHFARTTFTDEYAFDDWRAETDERALPVLLLSGDGDLVLHGPRFPVRPRPGDTLVAWRPPEPGDDSAAPPPLARSTTAG